MVFSDFALNSGKTNVFSSVKFLGKVGIFFSRIFFLKKLFCEIFMENLFGFFFKFFLGSRLSWGTRLLSMHEY